MTDPTTTGRPGITHRIVERKVGDLSVDPKVQRGVKTARINKIAGDFDPAALGVLTTSYRTPELIHIVDGQHRYRAAEMAAYTGPLVTMQYEGLSLAEEAALFRKLNQTEKVSAVDQHLVACIEGQPQAVRIAKVLKDNGWSVSSAGGDHRLSAIRALERADTIDPTAAALAVNVLTAAFGHIGSAVNGSLIEGLTKVLARNGEAVNVEDLARRLATFPGGADGLLGHARGQAVTHTGNLSQQVARIVVGIYNQRRRTTALPEWK